MRCYHVTTYKKLQKYITSGHIKAPVRAWTNIQQAERMSKSTSRKIILRLNIKDFEKLEGHYGEAIVCNKDYILHDM